MDKVEQVDDAFASCSPEDIRWAHEALKLMEPVHHAALGAYANAQGGLTDEEVCRKLRMMGEMIRQGWRCELAEDGEYRWTSPQEAAAVH